MGAVYIRRWRMQRRTSFSEVSRIDVLAVLTWLTFVVILNVLCDLIELTWNLSQAFVARINEVNSTLHAVLQINPDALDIAHKLDVERAHGRVRG